MKTKDDLLRELDVEEMQRYVLVVAPQRRNCPVCGRELLARTDGMAKRSNRMLWATCPIHGRR